MSDKYDFRQTIILAELRQRAGLTQDQAGEFLGLLGRKRRDSVSSWEHGEERPNPRLRTKFIAYLLDKLNLRYSTELFVKVWNDVMVKQWGWLPLSKGEISTLRAPFQAIADIPYFVGRERELQDLKTALLAGHYSAICSVQGMGGVGKTALAAHAAYQLRPEFPDGVLWARLDTSDVMSILATFAQAYDCDVSQYTDLDSRSRVVRNILAHRRVLIVLDNVESNEQIQPLLPPTTGSCAVIVTTRYTNLPAMLGAHWINIGPFDKEKQEAFDLFARVLGVESVQSERSVYGEIADLLGHLPLAIAIAAGRIAHEPSGSAAKFLDVLRAEKTRLGELVFGDWSVRLSFGISYDRLVPDLRQFYMALGAFSGEDFDAEAAAHVAGRSLSEAHEMLKELYGLSLVQFGRAGRYRLHPLLRDYAREKMDAGDAFVRMAEYYDTVLDTARKLYEQGAEALKRGLELFDLERENIQAGQAWAEAHLSEDSAAALCCRYPISGGSLLRLRQRPTDRIRWCKAGLSAARRLKKRSVEGEHLAALGLAYNELGEVRTAVEYLNQALSVFDEIGNEQGECGVLSSLGLTYVRLGQFQPATSHLKKSLVIARKIGNRREEGDALGNLAIVYKNQGKFDHAIRYHKQALAVARETGDRVGEVATLNDLGSAHLEAGRPRPAVEYYEEALTINREIGYRRVESDLLGNLGWAYACLGRYDRAIEYYQQALGIDREIENRFGEGITLNNLGGAYTDSGKPNEAIEFHEQALAIARDVGDRVGEADALIGLGSAYQSLAQIERAIDLYHAASVICREVGYQQGEGLQLMNLGNAYRDLGQYKEAIHCYQEARSVAEQIKNRLLMSKICISQGELYLKQHKWRSAEALFLESLQITRAVGAQDCKARAVYGLAKMATGQGKTAQAYRYGRESLSIYKSIGHFMTSEVKQWLDGLRNEAG